MMTNESIILKTKQGWKLLVSISGLLISGGGMFYSINKMQHGGNLPIVIDLLSVTAGILIGIFTCLSIRCPDCGLKWVWYAVSNKDINQWIFWLLSFGECPRCEYNADEKPGR